MAEVITTLPAGLPLAEVVRHVRQLLTAGGIDGAQREARMLVCSALAIPPETLLLHPDRRLEADDTARVECWLRRRLAREPLGRIAGEREFYGRPFALSAETLEPRADSETVIDVALELIAAERRENAPLRIIDVGTGSGCLLITLLAELPDATGVGTDISADALATAQANASRLGVGGRAEWRRTAGLEGITERFDVLISNPPYIPSTEIAGLKPEVRLYDPPAALDGGADGLDVYRQIARRSRQVVPAGILIFEVAAEHHPRVANVFAEICGEDATEWLGSWRDLAGHTRCVALRTLPIG